MCMEVDELLSYDGWLSRPIELPESEPLAGCCLCVRYKTTNLYVFQYKLAAFQCQGNPKTDTAVGV